MKQYLVQWRNLATNQVSNLIKTWPEILAIIKKMKEVGGELHIYRLDTRYPEQVFVNCVNHTHFWLEDAYDNIVEG